MNAHTQIAKAVNYYNNDKLVDAERAFKRLIKKEPRDFNSYCYLASIYQRQNKHDKCEQSLAKALKINPHCTSALNLYSDVKAQNGDFDGAETLLRRGISIDENNIPSLLNLLKMNPGDFQIRSRLVDMIDDSLPVDKYAAIAFAIGGSYDNQGEYEQAYEWFLKGNNRRFYTRDLYSHDAHKTYNDTLKYLFTPEKCQYVNGHPSDDPIFIIGMPRSGTTLTEQIISSHMDVCAGGEMPWMTRLAQNTDFDEKLFMDFKKLGKQYLTKAGIVRKTTDKLPNNFHFIALIRCCFPNAKIVHVNRDREDCLLSCWQANFTAGNLFAFHWDDLNKYYDDYLDIVDYYRGFIDIYDIDYEALVTNQEVETRALISNLGLEWDERCLYPEGNDSAIRTASIYQARKPVNTNSIGRFENYRKLLQK